MADMFTIKVMGKTTKYQKKVVSIIVLKQMVNYQKHLLQVWY
jgi:hypothetical protein